MFQDAYDWAGQTRSYDMKLEDDIFTKAEDIAHFFSTVVHKEIEECRPLKDWYETTTIKRLARYLGLINQIHPFPEGNGRTQRAFISQLAIEKGYTLAWDKMQAWENRITVQNVHRTKDYSTMERMIQKILIKC